MIKTKYQNDEDKPKTKFNAGLAKLERIDTLRRGCHDAKIISDYHKWKGCLRGYRGELNERMSKESRKKAKNTEEMIDLALTKGIIKKGNSEEKINSIQKYDIMYEYELWLNDLEMKFGFSMPDKKDGMDATGE